MKMILSMLSGLSYNYLVTGNNTTIVVKEFTRRIRRITLLYFLFFTQLLPKPMMLAITPAFAKELTLK
jgi:hypothetical protein